MTTGSNRSHNTHRMQMRDGCAMLVCRPEGCRTLVSRHAGDLGNVLAGDDGVADFTLQDTQALPARPGLFMTSVSPTDRALCRFRSPGPTRSSAALLSSMSSRTMSARATTQSLARRARPARPRAMLVRAKHAVTPPHPSPSFLSRSPLHPFPARSPNTRTR